MKNIKSFLLMVKYESLRVIRNKTMICLLVLFPIILLLILGSVINTTSYKVAINRNGIDITNLNVITLIKKSINIDNIIEVETDEQGKDSLLNGETVFFISLNQNKSDVSATIYYDASTIVGTNIKSSLTSVKNQYAYTTLKDLIKEWTFNAVQLDEKYFNLLSFKTINSTPANTIKSLYVLEFVAFLSIIMMFGLAFSISRDNETGVSKQIAYTPIGHNKYLLSKFIPYLILGLIQSVVMLYVGSWIFKMEYSMNLFIYLIFIFVFLVSLLSLGMLICTLKNQIVVAIVSMATIVIPIFTLISGFISSYPVYIRIFLYFMPATSFVELFRNIIFNHIILYEYLFILIGISILYYALTLIVMKKKSYQNR